jgi:hypothetical protein
MKAQTPGPRDMGRCHRRSTLVGGVSLNQDPMYEPEIARKIVLTALNSIVAAGFGAWSNRDDGSVELHLHGGERWLLKGGGMTRLA